MTKIFQYELLTSRKPLIGKFLRIKGFCHLLYENVDIRKTCLLPPGPWALVMFRFPTTTFSEITNDSSNVFSPLVVDIILACHSVHVQADRITWFSIMKS